MHRDLEKLAHEQRPCSEAQVQDGRAVELGRAQNLTPLRCVCRTRRKRLFGLSRRRVERSGQRVIH